MTGDATVKQQTTRSAAGPAAVVTGAVFHYAGPALAVTLFAQVGVLGAAWLRLTTAALVLGLWRRPWRLLRTASRQQLRTLAALGLVLAAMNSCFYLAIARLPLDTVAAMEFVGPVALAAAGVRSVRNAVAFGLVVAGVMLLSDVHLADAPLGFTFAAANAALFTGYIVLGHRISVDGTAASADRLAAAMLIALAAVTPVGAVQGAVAFSVPAVLATGAAVGMCSSAIPYLCDQFAMARMPRSTFALMLALLPGTAMLMGVLVLRQLPTPLEDAAVAAVAAGVALHHPRKAGPR